MASVKMIVAGLMMVASSHLSAQYTSLAERSVYTVKLVLDNASRLDKSDAVVKIRGYVTRKVEEGKFWFTDETGKIMLELDREYFPPFAFDDRTPVYIYGEVDYDLLDGAEIEVERIELARR